MSYSAPTPAALINLSNLEEPQDESNPVTGSARAGRVDDRRLQAEGRDHRHHDYSSAAGHRARSTGHEHDATRPDDTAPGYDVPNDAASGFDDAAGRAAATALAVRPHAT